MKRTFTSKVEWTAAAQAAGLTIQTNDHRANYALAPDGSERGAFSSKFLHYEYIDGVPTSYFGLIVDTSQEWDVFCVEVAEDIITVWTKEPR